MAKQQFLRDPVKTLIQVSCFLSINTQVYSPTVRVFTYFFFFFVTHLFFFHLLPVLARFPYLSVLLPAPLRAHLPPCHGSPTTLVTHLSTEPSPALPNTTRSFPSSCGFVICSTCLLHVLPQLPSQLFLSHRFSMRPQLTPYSTSSLYTPRFVG